MIPQIIDYNDERYIIIEKIHHPTEEDYKNSLILQNQQTNEFFIVQKLNIAEFVDMIET